jgi:hypothetical protein
VHAFGLLRHRGACQGNTQLNFSLKAMSNWNVSPSQLKVSSLMQRINPTTQMLISTTWLAWFFDGVSQPVKSVPWNRGTSWHPSRAPGAVSGSTPQKAMRRANWHSENIQSTTLGLKIIYNKILGNQKCSQSFGKKGGCSLTSSPWKRQSNGSTLQEL